MHPQVKRHIQQHAWTAIVWLTAGGGIVALMWANSGCISVLPNFKSEDFAAPMERVAESISKTSDKVIDSTERVAAQLMAPSTQPAAIAEKISASLTSAADSISGGLKVAASQPAAVADRLAGSMTDAATSLSNSMMVGAAAACMVGLSLVAALFRSSPIPKFPPEGATGHSTARTGAPALNSDYETKG